MKLLLRTGALAAIPFVLALNSALAAGASDPVVNVGNAGAGGQIVISQIYGGGGDPGSAFTNDFIELFNRGSSPVDVSGWSVQYASTGSGSWQVTLLTNVTIQPGQYYLVQEAAGGGGTTALPAPDVTGTIAMDAAGGKVALLNTTTSLPDTAIPPTCPISHPNIIDFVGYGNADCVAGLGAAPAPSSTMGDLRNSNGLADTRNNIADFSIGSPNPRNSAAPFNAGRLVKLNAADGTALWKVDVPNDGAVAVDPIDLSVYTALGGHVLGGNGTVYKFDAAGNPAWTNSISMNSVCDFEFVTNAAVDGTSGTPGVVWSENLCFGAIAKSDRATGTQDWSMLTYDIGRPSIDPVSGRIYTITNAGSSYDAETIYSVMADGTSSTYAASCEGYTDLNPADRMLYRGGNASDAHGCGTTLSQLDTTNLGGVNWTMDLSPYIGSFDALAVQPWAGGYIYVASSANSKIVVVDPATKTVVTSFNTAVVPKFIAVDPNGGNLYVADGVNAPGFVIAYSPTGALLWINPNLGGIVTGLATPRGVIGVPPVPVASATTNAATNVTDTSATLGGSVNPNGSSTTVYFEYGTSTAYGSQTANQVFTGNTSQAVTANVTGLATGTTYHYRLVAKNAGGTSVGSDVTFTTATPTPTPAPGVTTNAATLVSDTAATLNGTVNPNGSSTTVHFEYGTSTAYGTSTPDQTFAGSVSQSVSANITGLIAGTTYHFRIVATNAGGTVNGNDVTFVALSTCPVPTVRISSDRNAIHKGEVATISVNFGAASPPPCNNVTVYFTVKTHAKQGVDFVITDSTGAVITGNQANGSLFVHNMFTSRSKTLPVTIQLKKDSHYILGNTKVQVELLAN